jgi:hypothetical protein
MSLLTDTIVHGETYDIAVQAKDINGDPIVMDGTWSAATRITKGAIGGEIIAEPAMAIVDGLATYTLDTGESIWESTTYFYDVRLTNPDGDDFWTAKIRLTLTPRNTPSS